MWGGLGSDGASKLAGVRQSLDRALPRIAGRLPIGLATFGPGCRSAEMVVPPGHGTVERIALTLQRFNPRGKGPLVASLETAAQSFAPGARGHVVLFHDGLDNCGQNACAAAEAIRKSHPGVAIHTVSLGLEAAEQQAIACVALSTGGRAVAVADAAKLETAVADLAALIAGDWATPAPPPAPAAPVQSEPAPDNAPPRLVARAKLAAGTPPLTMPLAWRVIDAQTGAVTNETVAASLALPAKPGRVRVEAVAGRITVVRDVEIAATGTTEVDLVLEAGLARFETGARKLANDSEEPLIRLDRLADDRRAGERRGIATPLWIARGTAAEALLPPGSYRAVAEFGLARAETDITVTAGSETSVALPLEAGRLELSTTGWPAEQVGYTLAVNDPSRPSGEREIARSAHPSPAFVLSTGSYVVTASIAGAELRRVLAVRQGEVTRENFSGGLGRLLVRATVNAARPDAHHPVMLTLRPLAAAPQPQSGALASRRVPAERPVAVEPGRYRLSARLGPGGPAAERDIEIAAGQEATVGVDIAVAELQITGAPVSGSASAALCELRDAASQRVWRGMESAARIAVAPGRYTLRCGSGVMRRETAVAIAAGEKKAVAPAAP